MSTKVLGVRRNSMGIINNFDSKCPVWAAQAKRHTGKLTKKQIDKCFEKPFVWKTSVIR